MSGDTSSPPNISPTAAPGVAFNVAYEFSLPDERIAAAQEAHASACEHLGFARCRITGMSYSLDHNEQATKQKGETSTELTQLQQELAKTKPGSEAHAHLLTEIQSLQQQSSEQANAVAASQAALASTPMAFHYYGRGGVPGFRGNPFREAFHTLVTTVVLIIGFLLQALAVLLPLLIVMALVIALWRTALIRMIRRWVKGPEEATD